MLITIHSSLRFPPSVSLVVCVSLCIGCCFADCDYLFSMFVFAGNNYRGLWQALVVSVRKKDKKKSRSDCSLTAACRFRKPIWHRDALGVSQLTYPEQNRVKLTEGTVFLCLYLSVQLVSHTTPGPLSFSLSLCEWTQGWLGRWVGGQQHRSRSVSTSLHQHPQADHVRNHVPENADASHRPGWALQWGPGLYADCAGCDRNVLISSVVS